MRRERRRDAAPYGIVCLVGVLLFTCAPAEAYWTNVHEIMSRHAFQRAVAQGDIFLRLGLSEFEDFGLRVGNNPSAVERLSPVELVRKGSVDEDGGVRSLRHFYDVFDNSGFLGFASAPDWALGVGSNNNDRDFQTLRPLLYDAMTTRDNTERDQAWGTFFYHLGHLIHLVQDMGQPQHSRMDIHFHPGDNRLQGELLFTGYSRYEFRTGERAFTLSYDGYETVKLPDYRDYFDDDQGLILEQGLAQAAGFNFVSQDSNFDSLRYFLDPGMRPPKPHPMQIGDPEPTLIDYFVVNQSLVTRVSGVVPIRYITYSYRDEYSREIVNNPRLSGISVLDVANSEISLTGAVYTLTDKTIDSHAEILVPRAVGYSAGIIDHLFRGRMRISPPDDRIYALVDQSTMDDPDKGFSKLKLKLRNMTEDIPVRSAAGSAPVRQPIGEGVLVAIAKYRKSGCYEIDLSGEPDENSETSFVTPNGCSLIDFLRGPDTLSVSEPMPVDGIPSDQDKEVIFDFSNDVIPISARNLVIQVVFRGMLGVDDGIEEGKRPPEVPVADGPDEADAVIIATRDISEPTFIGALNMTDQVLIHGDYHTPAEVTSTPALRDAVIAEVSGVNSVADVEEWAKIEPAENLRIRINGTLVATRPSTAPGSHVRLALLADIDPPEEFPEGQGSLDVVVTYAFDFSPLGAITSGTAGTTKAFEKRLGTKSFFLDFSPFANFRGIHRHALFLMHKRVGTEQATDAERDALPPIFQPPLVPVEIAPEFQ